MKKSEFLGRLQESAQSFSCTLNIHQVYKLRNSSLDSASVSLSLSPIKGLRLPFDRDDVDYATDCGNEHGL